MLGNLAVGDLRNLGVKSASFDDANDVINNTGNNTTLVTRHLGNYIKFVYLDVIIKIY